MGKLLSKPSITSGSELRAIVFVTTHEIQIGGDCLVFYSTCRCNTFMSRMAELGGLDKI